MNCPANNKNPAFRATLPELGAVGLTPARPSFFTYKGHSQQGTAMQIHGTGLKDERRQRKMPFFSAAPPLRLLDDELIKACKDGTQALALTIRYGGLKDGDLAEVLGCHRTTITKYQTGGGGNPSPDRMVDLMSACRNVAVLQYVAFKSGFQLVPRESDTERADEIPEEAEITHEEAV